MAAPTYSTDLKTFNLCENTGTFSEFTNMIAGGTPTMDDADDPIQNQYMTSQTAKISAGALASISCDYGSGVTVPVDGAILIWHKFDAGGILNDYASGGVRIVVGSAIGVWKAWKIGGKDVPPNPYGGWKNYAIDPTLSTTGEYTYGSPSTPMTLQFAGMAVTLTATGPTKGQPHKIDAIRYGRCESQFSGGEAGNYAKFSGFAALNDATTARWGLIQSVAGGYLWKGLMTLGSGTAVNFVDSNTTIFIDDTRKVSPNFNKIQVRQYGSTVFLTNVSFQCTSPNTTASKGIWETVDDADIDIIDCQFTDMASFVFQPRSTIDSTVFRRCGQVTQSGSLFTGCSFSNSTNISTVVSGALLVDAIDNIIDCTFEAVTTSGHAVVYRPTGSGPFNVNWNGNQASGYASTDGSTNNETILIYPVTTTADINLTVINEATVPSIMLHATYAGTFDLIIPEITLTIEANVSLVGAEIRIYDVDTSPPDFGTELQGTESHDSVTYSYSGGAGNVIYIQIMKPGYEEFGQQTTIPDANGTYYALLEVETNA